MTEPLDRLGLPSRSTDSHGRTDGRTNEEATQLPANPSSIATPAGGLKESIESRLEAGDEALAAMGPMLAEIRAVMYLPDEDPRRQAAMAEKRRVLALIERSNGRRRFP